MIAGWHCVELEVNYLRTKYGDSVADLQWNLLVKPQASVDRIIYQIMAGLRAVTNRTIAPDFNLAAFALEDNRPIIAEK